MTKTCTANNPIGITDYNIEEWASLPGWQTLTQALNTVINEARDAGIPGNQDQLAATLNHLARGVAYMDCCPHCERSTDDTYVDTAAAPYNTTIKDNWVSGKYMCAKRHRWTCGYSISSPLYNY